MNIPACPARCQREASAELNIDPCKLCFYRTYTTHLNENKNCPEALGAVFLKFTAYLMISPIMPGVAKAAFDSSVSMCIARAYLGLTLTTTSPKTSERPSELILTETISLSLRPNFSASSGVAWMWRFATITPSLSSTSPAGPTSLHAPLPAISPDSRQGAFTPIERIFTLYHL